MTRLAKPEDTQDSRIVDSSSLRSDIADLLLQLGLSGEFNIMPVQGGANNQVCLVEGDFASLIAKVYFRHPDDKRDRLHAEFSFSRFLWNHGIRTIPQPLACDADAGLALYSYIDGRAIIQKDVTRDAIVKALEFFLKINKNKGQPDAAALPSASESCFSISDHLACVTQRMHRFQKINAASAVDHDAATFIQGDLLNAWQSVKNGVHAAAERQQLDMIAPIVREDRCLSPSDFGFHNAVMTAKDSLYFLDFEYAGWDDPAKFVCDFFCQPKFPISTEYFDWFVDTVSTSTTDPGRNRMRFSLLLPVYQIKWCCILLNEFLPSGRARRRFAASAEDNEDDRKAAQLYKAKQALDRVDY